jgi:hypothetical protein
MGAVEISRNSFLDIILESVKKKEDINIWNQNISLELN